MSALPGNPAVLKTKVDGLVASADTIQSAIDDLRKFVTSSKSKAVQATHEQVKNAEKSLEAAHGRYKNTGLALREYQAVLANCHKRAEAAAAREESANRQRSDAQGTVTATKRRLQQLQGSHAPSVNVMNAQNAYNEAVANERRATTAATAAASEIAQIAQEVDEAASRAIGKIDTAMSGTTDNLIDKISQFIEGIGKKLEEFGKWVATVLKKLVKKIAEVINTVIKVLIMILRIIVVIALGAFLVFLLASLIIVMLPTLLNILVGVATIASCIWLVAKGQKLLMDAYNIACGVAELVNGPADVHYGDNGETTETINTRPGREGLIRDKMDLAGRPNPRGDWREPPGWHEVGPEELRRLGIDPALLSNEQSGFHATLFRDDNGRYVLSYEGTDFNDLDGDVVADVMGAGATSAQVHQAILAATTVKQRLMSNGVTAGDFSLTGHSLGGELAAVGSIATASKATTFNAAGVSFTSMATATYAAKINGYDVNPVNARARVENYHFSTDPLTKGQTVFSLPEAFGKQVEVEATAEDWARFLDMERGHGLDALKEKYDAQYGHMYARRVDRVDELDRARQLA